MRLVSVISLVLLAGCAASEEPAGANRMDPAIPAGATLKGSGFITILESPPTPFPDNPPLEPQTLDTFARRTATGTPEERARAWEEANGSAEFQAEIQRLMQVLSQREPGNFVQLRLVRNPDVAAEVWFKRDAAATLGKYTDDPQFRPREGGLTQAEVDALSQIWIERTEPGGVITSLSGDPVAGTLEIGVGVSEAQFREIARQRGWQWGDEVTFTFAPAQVPAFSDTGLERLVRVFAREHRRPGIRHMALFTGRIALEDGCFVLEPREPGGDRQLVMFGYDTQLGRDPQGYLAVTSAVSNDRYRIGEMGNWGGPNGVDESNPDVKRLRQACGDAEVVNVPAPKSQRLFALPPGEWVLDSARVRGLTYVEAWDAVIDCLRRQENADRAGLDARNRCIRQFNE